MLELIQTPAYQHILLNHLPLTGLGVAWIVLIVSAIQRSRSMVLFSLGLVFLLSASAYVVEETGEEAAEEIHTQLDETSHLRLDHHADLAETWLPLIFGNAALAALGLFFGLWSQAWGGRFAWGVAFTTLIALGAASYIAMAGGEIRHPEFRLENASKPGILEDLPLDLDDPPAP